ncbi:mitochondrial carrier [Irpex rosettiformis]|uniref:Mitochondrial carrier n=1 Tax=Irpex rosettiformis TaxID=378272 RepID=A0ACB8UFW3_9APHY|nr:mitochondrial carrier [Irpex rosettiformis]
MSSILDILAVTGMIAASLAVSVPLTGALVRLRANFNPKSIQLDAEGNVEPHTGPVVTSFFGMLARVKRIEGWSGLYKGLMPMLLETSLLSIFVLVALDSSAMRYGGRIPSTGILGRLAYATVALILNLPAVVVTYRAITTPYRLPYFRPIYSLRILLTPTERRRPWMIYTAPGLFAAQFLHLVYKVIFVGSLKAFLLPSSEEPGDKPLLNASPVAIGVMIAIGLLSTVILCPLEVIASKLAIQRNHAAPEYNSVSQEVEEDGITPEEYVEYAGAEEDVIGLRHEKDPYLGLVDCAKRVIDEEGLRALYRAWWLTAFISLGNALA